MKKDRTDYASWIRWSLWGLLLGIGMVIGDAFAVPEDRLLQGVGTAVTFAAYVTNFRSRWKETKFWVIVLVLLTLHFALVWQLAAHDVRFDFRTCLILSGAEIVLFSIVTGVVFAGRKFSDEIAW